MTLYLLFLNKYNIQGVKSKKLVFFQSQSLRMSNQSDNDDYRDNLDNNNNSDDDYQTSQSYQSEG